MEVGNNAILVNEESHTWRLTAPHMDCVFTSTHLTHLTTSIKSMT